jgi:hypothetical protein
MMRYQLLCERKTNAEVSMYTLRYIKEAAIPKFSIALKHLQAPPTKAGDGVKALVKASAANAKISASTNVDRAMVICRISSNQLLIEGVVLRMMAVMVPP